MAMKARTERPEPDLLLSLGEDVETAARAFAARNGLRHERARSAAEVAAAADLAALVVRTGDLSGELFDALYETSRAVAPGIFCGTDAAEVALRLERPAEGPIPDGRGTDPCLTAYYNGPTTFAADPAWRHVGPDSRPEDLREALSGPNDLLVVHSHSDGIDAFLADELTLCAVAEADGDAPREAAPHCVVAGSCFRHKMPIEDALARGRLLLPPQVRARILLYAVCNGFLLPGDTIDHRWSAFASLNANPLIESIIARWEVSVCSPANLAPLVDAVSRGATVGEAVGDFNRRPATDRNGSRFAVFGDWRTRIEGRRSAALRSRPRPPAARLRRDSAACNFLRTILMDVLLHRPAASPALMEAAEAVAGFEAALLLGTPLDEPDGPGPRLRASVLAAIPTMPLVISHHWLSHFALRAVTPGRCPHCGARTMVRHYRGRLAGLGGRLIEICAYCDVVADRPAGWPVSLERGPGGEMRLTGVFPGDRSAALVRWVGKDPAQDRHADWPRDARGRLLSAAPPLDPPGPGLGRDAVAVMAGADIALFAGPLRPSTAR